MKYTIEEQVKAYINAYAEEHQYGKVWWAYLDRTDNWYILTFECRCNNWIRSKVKKEFLLNLLPNE